MSANGQLAPSELAPIAQGQLRKDAAAAWNAMNVEARSKGVELLPTGSKSSYRTYAQQVELWNLYKAGRGNLAAHPGSSNHGAGIAVDLASPAMRSMLDQIGHKYGWAKEWSDAQTEWWHIRWREGSWRGPDPGPYGRPAPPPVPKGTSAIATVVKQDGRMETFVEIGRTGEIFHAWQLKLDGGWSSWQSFGKP